MTQRTQLDKDIAAPISVSETLKSQILMITSKPHAFGAISKIDHIDCGFDTNLIIVETDYQNKFKFKLNEEEYKKFTDARYSTN